MWGHVLSAAASDHKGLEREPLLPRLEREPHGSRARVGHQRMRLSTPSCDRGADSPLMELKLPRVPHPGMRQSSSDSELGRRMRTPLLAVSRSGGRLGISGFTMERNQRVRELSQMSEDMSGADGSNFMSRKQREEQTKRDHFEKKQAIEREERQREEAYTKALGEVTMLIDQKKALELDPSVAADPLPSKKEATSPAAAAPDARKKSVQCALVRKPRPRPVDNKIYKLTSKRPYERVLARLQQVRTDEKAREALSARIEMWEEEKACANARGPNFVRANSLAVRSLSTSALDALDEQRASL